MNPSGDHERRNSTKSTEALNIRPGGSVGKVPSWEGGGVEAGGSRFHFARNSTYDTFTSSDNNRRASLLSQRSFGNGISGPLIAKHLLERTSSAEVKKGKPKRKKLRLIGCIGVIIGCVLGSGVFAAPQVILNYTESCGTTLIIWAAFGIIALLGALSYIELGCTIPVPGGDYAYLYECWGPLAAFLFQWAANFVIVPGIIALVANVAATNLVYPFLNADCELTTHAFVMMKCIAIAFIFLVTYMNCKGPEITEKIQGYLMINNLFAIGLMIVCGIVHMSWKGMENRKKFRITLPTQTLRTSGKKGVVLNMVLATYQASFSYFGYTFITYIMEDVENPLRTLPIALCISIPFIMAVLILVNFSYFAAVPYADLVATKTVATEMMKALVPLGHPSVKFFIWFGPLVVVIAVIGAMLSSSLTCSRLACIGARNGHFPKLFEMIHYKTESPIISILFACILSILYLFIEIKVLIGILTYCESMINTCVILGLINIRIRRRDLHRPFKLPLIVPILYATINIFLFFTPIFLLDKDSYKETLPILASALFVFVLGIPVYYLFVTRRWKCLDRAHGKLRLFLQKLCLVHFPTYEIMEAEMNVDEIAEIAPTALEDYRDHDAEEKEKEQQELKQKTM